MAPRVSGRPALPLLLLLALLTVGGAVPETELVRVLHPDAGGATDPATAPLLTVPADSSVQCAARCTRRDDCRAISYAPAGPGFGSGGTCTLRSCPAGWDGWRSSCYLISAAAVPRSQAVAECGGHGAGLASITSQEEHDFIRQLAQERSVVRIYLGLHHQPPYAGREYVWDDGSALNFTRWGDSEPFLSDPAYERGVYLQVLKDAWHTWTAQYSFNYACEYVVQ
ncbi:C-type lectin domain family 4 member A [Amphibalanus amphitrite]|uniref:C-type lectin domain family 4 member A n=1 Tax=Amphibalanus amphitrite TaxID=1232801 RepID=A0A6A4X5T8_AMPAM|nr:C-type lectin domain family 4 member A [Amphibalanus amphitrite]